MSEQTKQKTGGWLSRLAGGLSKSSDKIGGGIADIFSGRPLDDDALEELEELLITADLGPAPAAKIVAQLAGQKFGRNADPDEVKAALKQVKKNRLKERWLRFSVDMGHFMSSLWLIILYLFVLPFSLLARLESGGWKKPRHALPTGLQAARMQG